MANNKLFDKAGFVKKIFIIFYVCFMSPCVLAQEIVPFLQSLAVQQKADQMKAAPSGVDEPQTEVILFAPSVTPVIKDKKPSEIEKSVAETLNHISLEEKIQSQEIQQHLEQFGYDLFSETPITFLPITDIPVPQDYLIGSGE